MNNGILLLILFSLSLLSASCFAEDKHIVRSEKKQQSLSKENSAVNEAGLQTKTPKKIKYIPPFLGAPSTDRLRGMGVRSAEKQIDLLFSALTPTHTGLTSQSQPLLYWFTSKPVSQSFQFIEFVLNSEESIAPILRIQLPHFEKKGIHPLKMADFGITLKPEIEYWWSIALVKNPQARSLDFVSSGKIKYLKPADKLLRELQESPAEKKASIYAQSGYWYEAIETAIKRQKQQPNNLSQLLNQVGLQRIARYFTEKQK